MRPGLYQRLGPNGRLSWPCFAANAKSTESIAVGYWANAGPPPTYLMFERHPWPAAEYQINRPDPEREPL